MKKFEYKILKISPEGFWSGEVKEDTLNEKINALGQEGWELVSVIESDQTNNGIHKLVTFFKREVIF